jgi:RimJ/RimL family protein N-acetyltransferase
VLPADRSEAARLIAAELAEEWPHPDLLDILPMQADSSAFGVWVLIERASATVIGDAGFLGAPGADRTVEIGYSVVPACRGHGYATEGVAALVEWALAQPGVETVVAECDSDNTPSIRTLERLGFALAGESHGRLRWRLDGLT